MVTQLWVVKANTLEHYTYESHSAVMHRVVVTAI
jgi:hypothetical protein